MWRGWLGGGRGGGPWGRVAGPGTAGRSAGHRAAAGWRRPAPPPAKAGGGWEGVVPPAAARSRAVPAGIPARRPRASPARGRPHAAPALPATRHAARENAQPPPERDRRGPVLTSGHKAQPVIP